METRLPLLVKRLSQNARLPSKGSKLAAGYDLYSSEETTIPARGKGLVKTGISIAVPSGNYGRVGKQYSSIFILLTNPHSSQIWLGCQELH